MRTNKILFAIWLFLLGAQECFRMWRETGNGWQALLFLVIILFLSGLVVRSAFKRTGLSAAPSKGWRTAWTIIGVLSVLGIFGSLLEAIKPRTFYHFVTVGSLKIPIDDCLSGSNEMVPDAGARNDFCTCLATRMGSDTTIVRTSRTRLERGGMLAVMEGLMKEKGPAAQVISECFASGDLSWTDRMREGARETCLAEIRADTAYRDYDPEKFCDCVVSGLSAHSPADIIASGDDSTGIRALTAKGCLERSRR